MTKKQILDYIMTTPENTNRQILSYMLNDISGGEGNIPIPEYESEVVDASDNTVTLDLDLDNIEEDFILIQVLDPEDNTIYLLVNKAGNGIVFCEDEILRLIAKVEKDENGTLCYLIDWPPQYLEVLLGSCDISLHEEAIDALEVFMPVLQYSDYTKPWLTTKKIPIEDTLTFDFYSDEEGKSKSIYFDTFFLQDGWTLGIRTQSSSTDAVMHYNGSVDQYYLTDLADGDNIVLTAIPEEIIT